MSGSVVASTRRRRLSELRGTTLWILIAGVGAMGMGVAIEMMPLIPLGLTAVALAIGGYVIAPTLVLAAVLILRPALDQAGALLPLGGGNVLGAMGAGTVVGGAAYIAVRRPRLPRAVVVPAAAFLALGLLSLAWSFDRGEGVSAWLGLAVYPVVFCVAAGVVRDVRDFHRLVAVLLTAAVVPVVVGVVQIAIGARVVKEGYSAIQGTMVHPNSYALILLVAVVVGLVAFMESPPGGRRRLLAAGLVLASVCIFFTYARAAWGALVAVMLLLAVLRYRQLVVIGAVGAILVVLAFPSSAGQLTGRFADLSPGTAEYSNNSLSWRKQLWNRMLPYAEEHVVRGHGLGTFLPLTNVEVGVFDYEFQNGIDRTAANIVVYPHNDYLWLVVEVGVVGTVLWILLLLGYAATAWQSRRVPELAPYGIAAAGLVIAFLAVSATDNVKDNVPAILALSALIGGLYGASNGHRAVAGRRPHAA